MKTVLNVTGGHKHRKLDISFRSSFIFLQSASDYSTCGHSLVLNAQAHIGIAPNHSNLFNLLNFIYKDDLDQLLGNSSLDHDWLIGEKPSRFKPSNSCTIMRETQI